MSTVTFELAEVPPSFANRWAQHWSVQSRERKAWKERAYFAAQQARVLAKLGAPTEKTRVEIVLYRARYLDHDNAYSSIKPILDSLQGVLIVKDSPAWCDLLVRQVKVAHRVEQRVLVTVETVLPSDHTSPERA